jgi:hypothetical protein
MTLSMRSVGRLTVLTLFRCFRVFTDLGFLWFPGNAGHGNRAKHFLASWILQFDGRVRLGPKRRPAYITHSPVSPRVTPPPPPISSAPCR